jgi:hypothetical protein
MVEINEMQDGFQVSATAYRETFASKFKAIMAAHAVAMTHAVETGEPQDIIVPMGWGESVVVRPG